MALSKEKIAKLKKAVDKRRADKPKVTPLNKRKKQKLTKTKTTKRTA